MTRDEAIEYMCDPQNYSYDGAPLDLMKDCEAMDALRESLKGAKWLEDPRPFNESPTARFICSNCGRRTGYRQARSFNYCPNCGAKMAHSEN